MLTIARYYLLPCALITLIVALIYGQTHSFEFVEYDDTAYITENEYVSQGLNKHSILWALTYEDFGKSIHHSGIHNLWHPLTWISHMIDVELFGLDNPGAHHLFNAVLYLAGAIFTYLCFLHISGARLVALIATLLFIAHPLKVESVAWVSERKDLLSGFFFWSSLWALLKSWNSNRHTLWWGFATLLFLAGLLSKPSIVILPVIVMLVRGYQRKETRWDLDFLVKGLKENIVWFALSITIAAIAIYFQTAGSHSFFADSSSMSSRLLSSGVGLLFYLYRILIPIHLSFEYPYPKLPYWAWGLAWATILTFAYLIWHHRKRFPRLFFAAVWFGLCWFPVSGVFYIGTSFTCDRYLYLALAGPVLALSSWVYSLPEQFKKPSFSVLGIMILSWSALSWQQTKIWRNSHDLFSHAIQAQPKAAINWTNLASLTQLRGDAKKAISLHQKAIELNPKDYISTYNIGLCYQHLKELHQAEHYYKIALDHYPEYLPAMRKLAEIHILNQDLGSAAQTMRKVCDLNHFQEINDLWLLCRVEFNRGNLSEASHLLSLLKKFPNLSAEFSKAIQQMSLALEDS